MYLGCFSFSCSQADKKQGIFGCLIQGIEGLLSFLTWQHALLVFVKDLLIALSQTRLKSQMRVVRHAALLREEKTKVVDPKHLSFSLIWFCFCQQGKS